MSEERSKDFHGTGKISQAISLLWKPILAEIHPAKFLIPFQLFDFSIEKSKLLISIIVIHLIVIIFCVINNKVLSRK